MTKKKVPVKEHPTDYADAKAYFEGREDVKLAPPELFAELSFWHPEAQRCMHHSWYSFPMPVDTGPGDSPLGRSYEIHEQVACRHCFVPRCSLQIGKLLARCDLAASHGGVDHRAGVVEVPVGG